MTINWPGDLPDTPQWGSWQEEMEDNKASFAPSVGPPIERRRVTVAGELCTFNLIVTGTQKTSLKSFYRSTLKDGSLSFDGDHFRNPTGADVTWRFNAPPSFREYANDLYIAAMKLRLMP